MIPSAISISPAASSVDSLVGIVESFKSDLKITVPLAKVVIFELIVKVGPGVRYIPKGYLLIGTGLLNLNYHSIVKVPPDGTFTGVVKLSKTKLVFTSSNSKAGFGDPCV